MIYICLTEIDTTTKIICTDAPMATGPCLPFVKGFFLKWTDQSNWPVPVINGVYKFAPKYYGTCEDDAVIDVVGVLEILTEETYNTQKLEELNKRKPYPSWIIDVEGMKWSPPSLMPNDGKEYYWNETTVSWVVVTQVNYL